MSRLSLAVACCLFLALPMRSGAAFIDLSFGGASSFDGWVDLTFANFAGYGSFPGFSPWPAPMESNEALSGDARLSRLSGGVDGGGPLPLSMSLYFGSFFQEPNRRGGTLRISDPTPLAGAKTVAFQIQIGEADGYDFHEPAGTPVLRVNGSTVLAPFVTQLLNRYQNGTFFSPETEQDEPVYVNSWGFQWNINGLGPITSLEIDFSGVTHSQIYRMRLDQAEDMVTRNLFLPEFRLIARGQPVFDGFNTTVTHRFASSPDTPLDVDFRSSLASPWVQAPGPHLTGPDGSVDVVFTASGNHAAAWSRGMFFRAAYQFSE